MKKYSYNKNYKICVNFDGGIYDYYLEKKEYGDLYHMFGILEFIEPSDLDKNYIDLFIKQTKQWRFWR